MNCAKCGLDLPQGVKQCPKCGSFNEFAPPAPKKAKPVVYVIAALALVVLGSIVFAAVMASRAKPIVTQAPSGTLPPGNVVSAPPGALPGGNVVSAPPGAPAPGAPMPAGATKPKPPQQVVDYLEFVRKVEEHRQLLLKDTDKAMELAVQGIMGAMVGATESDKNPWQPMSDELDRQHKNWASTLEYFDKKAAPNECREFSGAYRDMLQVGITMQRKLADGIKSIDPSKSQDAVKMMKPFQEMLGGAQKDINAKVDAADTKLIQCSSSRYDMKKPFDIYREESGGNVMGVPGAM